MEARRSNRTPATTLARNIKLARRSAGMTQSKLAEALDLSDLMVVSKWERGVYRPSEQNLCALSRLFDRDLAWFYTDHDAVPA